MIEDILKSAIRDIPDFPKPGIIFKDITTVLTNPKITNQVLDYLVDLYKDQEIDVITGIESRGFLFGFALATRLNLPFVLIRKKGKLPYEIISYDYDLEYGTSTVEMHVDAIQKGQRVLIHDDLLATGGSAEAAARLIEKVGGKVVGFNFLVELAFLEGKKKIEGISSNIDSLAIY